MSATASPLLLAAQRELEKRRKELARERHADEQRLIKNGRTVEQRPLVRQASHKARQASRGSAQTAVSWQLYNGQKELIARRQRQSGEEQGAQQGWGGEGSIFQPVQQKLVQLDRYQVANATSTKEAVAEPSVEAVASMEDAFVARGSVRVYPSLATAVLQAELSAAGRLYWLLRYVDRVGRGWLAVEQIREVLTGKASVLRVCGWRRLRQLLQQGAAKLWERDGQGRLWLYSPARILERLAGNRLEGRPVAVPVGKLLGGIGAVRAYLYATFHAGRQRVGRQESAARPITRATIQGKTAVSATTQRRYEQIAEIQVQANVALGGRWQDTRCEQAAWERGRAIFEFVDGLGEMGGVNGRYIAWRLGNSYESGLVQLPKGRQKKLNRRLPLVIDGRGGREKGIERLYYPNGKAAARVATRRSGYDHYFPTSRAGISPAGMGHVVMWHVVGGSP